VEQPGRSENGSGPAGGRRFLFYSNESIGLGHLRRSLTLARKVTERDSGSSALVVTGSQMVSAYRLPPRVESVKLPAMAKDGSGGYRPQRLLDELVPVLEHLKSRACRLVLGLRDVEDSPENVRRRWGGRGMREAIERYYETILVYGPPSGVDALRCMGWDDLDVPVHHVGYVAPELPGRRPLDLPRDYVLATVGGGADGYRLLSNFIEAIRLRPLPCPAVAVTGPLMDPAWVARLRLMARGLDVLMFDFREDMEAAIAGARGVVSMAGYNTVTELLMARRPALLLPGVRPSREQVVRAEWLAARRMVDVLHDRDLTAATMRVALDRLLTAQVVQPDPADYAGAERAAAILTSTETPAVAPVATVACGS
jgi:predicted glycosyltransferase